MVYVLNGTRYDSNECFIAVVLRLLAQFLRILGDSMDERFLRLFYLSQDEEGRKEGTLSRRTSRNTGGGGDPLAGYIESRRISLVAPQRLSRQLKGQT